MRKWQVREVGEDGAIDYLNTISDEELIQELDDIRNHAEMFVEKLIVQCSHKDITYTAITAEDPNSTPLFDNTPGGA